MVVRYKNYLQQLIHFANGFYGAGLVLVLVVLDRLCGWRKAYKI
jgi:hypothetical protein